MADFVSGIKPTTPAYPVKPTQPSQREREPGKQKNKRREPVPADTPPDGDDAGDKPLIDDHV